MMMISTADTQFQLTILGYQFPHRATEPYDSNWLRVRIDAATSDGVWSKSDPCLLTYEAAQVADWLDSLARPGPTAAECSFTEPCLAFELTRHPDDHTPHLLVHCAHELRPPWIHDDSDPEAAVTLVFPLAAIDLTTCAADLREQLRAYPQRAAV
jgi:hypothetical protein